MTACFLGAWTLLAEVFDSLSYPQTTHQRKSFGVTEVEVMCHLEQAEPSHRSSHGCESQYMKQTNGPLWEGRGGERSARTQLCNALAD